MWAHFLHFSATRLRLVSSESDLSFNLFKLLGIGECNQTEIFNWIGLLDFESHFVFFAYSTNTLWSLWIVFALFLFYRERACKRRKQNYIFQMVSRHRSPSSTETISRDDDENKFGSCVCDPRV